MKYFPYRNFIAYLYCPRKDLSHAYLEACYPVCLEVCCCFCCQASSLLGTKYIVLGLQTNCYAFVTEEVWLVVEATWSQWGSKRSRWFPCWWPTREWPFIVTERVRRGRNWGSAHGGLAHRDAARTAFSNLISEMTHNEYAILKNFSLCFELVQKLLHAGLEIQTSTHFLETKCRIHHKILTLRNY